ncbi:MAG: hypothetical protein WCL14_04615 [Bacteroidota bacterium]
MLRRKGEAFSPKQRYLPKAISKLPAIDYSPDSSGSPLLGIGNGQAAAKADSGTKIGREANIGSKKELGIIY